MGAGPLVVAALSELPKSASADVLARLQPEEASMILGLGLGSGLGLTLNLMVRTNTNPKPHG